MMSGIEITKMHGAGNDYVYVDIFNQDEPAIGWSELARRVSCRHLGVGADGLILIAPPQSESADGSMRMFNADGSESEMCGNGLRCVAKFLHDRRLNFPDQIKVDTGAGLLDVAVIERDEKNLAKILEISMGTPILEAEKIPMRGMGNGNVEKLMIEDREYEFIAVGMGNPHCVIFVDDVETFPVSELGPQIENMKDLFPNRVNVEFVQILSEKEVIQRTWERGSGETLACGTGACAVCVAGVLWEKLNRELHIHLKGGDLNIRWDDTNVFLRGPAEYVFDGALFE